jgi:hypothetical protein
MGARADSLALFKQRHVPHLRLANLWTFVICRVLTFSGSNQPTAAIWQSAGMHLSFMEMWKSASSLSELVILVSIEPRTTAPGETRAAFGD